MIGKVYSQTLLSPYLEPYGIGPMLGSFNIK